LIDALCLGTTLDVLEHIAAFGDLHSLNPS